MASWGKRTLIGCGIGCGTLILLVVIALVTFGIWINQPGELLEPETLLGPSTTGYLEWTLRLEDPGTEGFVRTMIETVHELPPEANHLPSWLRSWIVKQQKKKAEDDILRLFPMVAAWTLQPGAAAGEDLHLLTVSVEKIGNQLVFGDWVLGFLLRRIPEARVHGHRREKIYQLPLDDEKRRLTFFLRDADVFVTSDLETARLAVDRLSGASLPEQGSGGLEALFASTGQHALRGALASPRGELGRLWSLLPAAGDEPVPSFCDEVRGTILTGGLEASGSFAGRLEFLGPDGAWAAARATVVDRAIRHATSGIRAPLELTTTPAGDRVRVEFRLPDLAGWVDGLIDHGVRFDDGSRKVRIGM